MQIILELFGGLRNNAYLCNAKMIERYERMPPPCGCFCICQIMKGPHWGSIASGNGNAPVAKLNQP